jgi:hypothetical protein
MCSVNGEVIRVNSENLDQVLRDYTIQTGDLLYWGTDERKSHATIISAVTDTDILYAGNTTRRFDWSLTEALPGSTTYIVRIRDAVYDPPRFVDVIKRILENINTFTNSANNCIQG